MKKEKGKLVIEAEGMRIKIIRGTAKIVRAIVRAADEAGTVHPMKMVGFSSDPRNHTEMDFVDVLRMHGAEIIAR